MTDVLCQWFAMCANPAAGCVSHPIIGWVPTCERCASKLELELLRGDFTFEGPRSTNPGP